MSAKCIRWCAIAEQYLSVTKAVEYIGTSHIKISDLQRDKELPYFINPLDNRKKLIPVEALDKLKQAEFSFV